MLFEITQTLSLIWSLLLMSNHYFPSLYACLFCVAYLGRIQCPTHPVLVFTVETTFVQLFSIVSSKLVALFTMPWAWCHSRLRSRLKKKTKRLHLSLPISLMSMRSKLNTLFNFFGPFFMSISGLARPQPCSYYLFQTLVNHSFLDQALRHHHFGRLYVS